MSGSGIEDRSWYIRQVGDTVDNFKDRQETPFPIIHFRWARILPSFFSSCNPPHFAQVPSFPPSPKRPVTFLIFLLSILQLSFCLTPLDTDTLESLFLITLDVSSPFIGPRSEGLWILLIIMFSPLFMTLIQQLTGCSDSGYGVAARDLSWTVLSGWHRHGWEW